MKLEICARAMTARMHEQDTDHLWLDARGLEDFDQRFPTIAASLRHSTQGRSMLGSRPVKPLRMAMKPGRLTV